MKEQIYLEIRSAEGGMDSKLLVRDFTSMYCKLASGRTFSVDIIDEREGQTTLLIEGKSAFKLLKNECGGHRVQRIPPTEKNGRVHTSTVTVAVLPVQKAHNLILKESELSEQFICSGGNGGQNVNKVSSCVRLKHEPSGVMVVVSSERSQKDNRRIARELLQAKLQNQQITSFNEKISKDRKEQVGSGQRGDKIRTYREQDDNVTDHRLNKKTKYSKLRKGDWSDLK